MSDITVTPLSSVTHEGFTVSSYDESADQLRENLLESQAKPKDGELPDPEKEAEEKVSRAASELGKKGAEAAAKARAAEAKAEAKAAKAEEKAGSEVEAEPEKEVAAEPEKPLGKPRDDPRARMLEATRQKAEIARELEKTKAEAAAAKAERDALKAQVESAKTSAKPAEAAPGKPTPDKFQTYDEYVEALADYKADERVKAFKAEAEQKAKADAYAKTIDDALGKALAARKEYEKTDPQFSEKLSEEIKQIANSPSFARDMHEKLNANHVIADEIIEAEKVGPALMLHLSDHPEDLQRIQALHTPQAIQVEMRLLARSLNGAVTPAAAPKAEVSKARPPVRPVTGSPHTADPNDIAEDEPFDSYARKMNARKRSARGVSARL